MIDLIGQLLRWVALRPRGGKDNASTAEPAIAEEVVPSAESTPPQFLPIPIVVDDRDAPGAVDPVDHDQLIADGPYEAQEPELHQTETEVDNSNDTHEPDAGGLDGGMDVDVVMQSGIPVDDCRSHADVPTATCCQGPSLAEAGQPVRLKRLEASCIAMDHERRIPERQLLWKLVKVPRRLTVSEGVAC